MNLCRRRARQRRSRAFVGALARRGWFARAVEAERPRFLLRYHVRLYRN